MACTNKADLIAVTEKENAKLRERIAPVDRAHSQMGQINVSIKDVIGHRGHWIGLFLGCYKDGKAGKKVFDQSHLSGPT